MTSFPAGLRASYPTPGSTPIPLVPPTTCLSPSSLHASQSGSSFTVAKPQIEEPKSASIMTAKSEKVGQGVVPVCLDEFHRLQISVADSVFFISKLSDKSRRTLMGGGITTYRTQSVFANLPTLAFHKISHFVYL